MKSLNNLGWKEQLHTRPYLTQTPAHSRAQMSLHRDFSSQVLNTSKDRGSTGSLGNLFQYLTVPRVKTKPKQKIQQLIQITNYACSNFCLSETALIPKSGNESCRVFLNPKTLNNSAICLLPPFLQTTPLQTQTDFAFDLKITDPPKSSLQSKLNIPFYQFQELE